jgi:arsenate reductase-like glutaredoxin family protein
MLPSKKKKKGRNALKIAQEPMSQGDFRDLVEQRMDRKKLDKMFPKQGDFLRWLKKSGNANGPRVRGV